MDGMNFENNPKILIVDDNHVNIMLLQKMLAIHNYTNIITTTDPYEVMELYDRNKPDLILLDLKMPGMDGFQVMQKLYEYDSNECIPIIMITAQDDKENRLKALDMGVRDFIGKPFDQTELIMRIRNTLNIKIRQNNMKVENIILQDKVVKGSRDLEIMQLDLIKRLLKAAEVRDNDTGNHINRIGMYSHQLAKLMGKDKLFCDRIIYASMMHDIGKIGIPDNILLKEGPLDFDEWEIMKQHTTKGAQILSGSNSDVLKMGEKIALSHHERWNGKGYPFCFSGEEIPIEGRITAICDVFDALISKRPYKEAWKIEKVFEEIKDQKGIHFDPEIAEIFLDNIEVFVKIRNDF